MAVARDAARRRFLAPRIHDAPVRMGPAVAACPSAHGDHAVLGAHGRVQGQPAAPAHEGFSCTPPAYCGDNLVHEVGVSLTRIGGTPLRMDITRRLGDLGDIPGSRVVLGFRVELR